MNSVESLVLTEIAKAVRAEFENADIASEYVRKPSQFPHISIVESDNYMFTEGLDSSDTERYSTTVYEINVYSNKTSGKKAECKKIMQIIDSIMYRLNFVRTALTPVPNLEDATIYRIIGRYTAVTDGTTVYRT